jgi:hypothetical protein
MKITLAGEFMDAFKQIKFSLVSEILFPPLPFFIFHFGDFFDGLKLHDIKMLYHLRHGTPP